jgi:hypothetical protein
MIAENQYVHLGAQEAIECLRRAADDRPFSLNDVERRAVRRANVSSGVSRRKIRNAIVATCPTLAGLKDAALTSDALLGLRAGGRTIS